MAIVWSKQQADFIEWAETGKGSCVLEAVAGAGKTTTLIEASRRLTGTTAILAYNKKIADELQEKIKGMNDVKAGTVHSFGNAAIRKTFGHVKVDGYKVANITQEIVTDEAFIKWHPTIVKLVSFAKQRALGVLAKIDDDHQWFDIADHFDVFSNGPDRSDNEKVPEFDLIQYAKKVLKVSNETTKVIDFDDMVYLPVLLGLNMWRYDNVMVDEAQDTNPARRALVRALVKKGGRVIAVGDRHQAIYGFTGADSNSLELIAKDFNCIELPLTITYRCPKTVVSFAKQWVSHIESAETSPDGSVSQITMGEFLSRKDLDGKAAVLCRLTAPLVKLAFSLIRNRIACKFEGRDIGQNLIKLAKRWKVKTTDKLLDKLADYLEREKTKYLAKKLETKAQQVEDQVETLKVIIEFCNNDGKHSLNDLVSLIETMFSDDVRGILTLSTIHKSKGREWNNVFWLDRANTCPSKYARQVWQIEQEHNLCYVAATRAKQNLFDLLA